MRRERLARLGAPRPCLLVAPTLLLAANLGVATARSMAPASEHRAHAITERHQLARIPLGATAPTKTLRRIAGDLSQRLSFRAVTDRNLPVLTAPPTTLPPPPPPPPPPLPPPLPVASVWRSLAQCESGGNWQRDSGNGYYGGLQFDLPTWQSVGGVGHPSDHPREVQIEMGERLLARSGWSAWPACSRRLGLV
ncbi:MAG: transglycosylase family protein [Actinomycetota bacterium]|nr:transglycosylase family protein [Actinomycetota bacterium]